MFVCSSSLLESERDTARTRKWYWVPLSKCSPPPKSIFVSLNWRPFHLQDTSQRHFLSPVYQLLNQLPPGSVLSRHLSQLAWHRQPSWVSPRVCSPWIVTEMDWGWPLACYPLSLYLPPHLSQLRTIWLNSSLTTLLRNLSKIHPTLSQVPVLHLSQMTQRWIPARG